MLLESIESKGEKSTAPRQSVIVYISAVVKYLYTCTKMLCEHYAISSAFHCNCRWFLLEKMGLILEVSQENFSD